MKQLLTTPIHGLENCHTKVLQTTNSPLFIPLFWKVVSAQVPEPCFISYLPNKRTTGQATECVKFMTSHRHAKKPCRGFVGQVAVPRCASDMMTQCCLRCLLSLDNNLMAKVFRIWQSSKPSRSSDLRDLESGSDGYAREKLPPWLNHSPKRGSVLTDTQT